MASMLDGPGTTVTFRRPGLQATFGLLCAFFGLFALGMVLSGGVLWWARILAGLAFVALAVVIWRVWALAIYAGPHDLVIRNFRNTHRIPWSDIEDICVTPPMPVAVYRENPLARQDVSLLVRLKEGAVISATLYDSRMFNRYSIQPREGAAEQLNELRRERSGTAGRT